MMFSVVTLFVVVIITDTFEESSSPYECFSLVCEYDVGISVLPDAVIVALIVHSLVK